MQSATSYRFAGIVIPVVTREPCSLLVQFGKRQPITCGCSVCTVRNAGMTQAEIIARIARANGVEAYAA